MPQLSMFRLYVLRAMYVFMFVGLALAHLSFRFLEAVVISIGVVASCPS